MSNIRLVCIVCLGLALCATAVAGTGSTCTVLMKSASDPGGDRCTDSDCSGACGLAMRTLTSTLNPGVIGLFERWDRKGSLVDAVAPNSPAAHAGVLRGDRILSVDGTATSLTHVTRDVWNLPGEHTLQLLRNEQVVTLTVRAEDLRQVLLKSLYGDQPSAAVSVPMRPFVTGINARPIGNQNIITAVLRGSPSDRAGLRAGDVIATVVASTPKSDAWAWVEGADYRGQITLEVTRDNQRLSFTVRMASVTELLRNAAEEAQWPDSTN